jgi:transcription antitermination factor NusG
MSFGVDIFEKPVICQSSWICAVTKPGSEFLAAANLELEDIETYVPCCDRVKSGTLRRTALFSGYLFIKLCERLPKLRKIDDITAIISLDNEPILVRQKVIDELRLREVAGAIPSGVAAEVQSGFTPGLSVRLMQGVYSGLTGTLERLCGHRRAYIHIQAFGGTTRVNVPLEALIPSHKYKPISACVS